MITRRQTLAGALAALAPWPNLLAADIAPTADALIARARARASGAWMPPSRVLAPPFDALDYDSYRGVRPKPGKTASLQLGPRFRADLLPPGWLFAEPVQISLPGHETRFALDMFDYDPALVRLPDHAPDLSGMGFSGLRLQTPLNFPGRWDEVLVLQGASYFRALAQDTVYGLSARALSLGTGGPVPEEFPLTQEIAVFDANESLHLGCLFDSPRAAGALIARLDPGRTTRMRCTLHLFPRETLADVGIAPLTSMFQHNAMGPARIDDFRPAVHDSVALIIDNGAGERVWRPLANPSALQMSAFGDDNPRGFGLLQSPASFSAFRDAEAAYHRRPSAWVHPLEGWGAGAVMLLEIPTENEYADNIVAFWRPAVPLGIGEHVFRYDLDWLPPGPEALPEQTEPLVPVYSASGIEPNTGTARLFVIDYKPQSGQLPVDLPLAGLPQPAGATLSGLAVYPLPEEPATLRVSFLLEPDDGTDVAELRLHLYDAAGQSVAPVWLYRWTRARGGGV